MARDLAPAAWRALMPDVRAVASDLAHQGQAVITQKGTRVRALTARGPMRIGLPEREQQVPGCGLRCVGPSCTHATSQHRYPVWSSCSR
nr:DUF3253 domain-containing protein [Roseobacter cerasinus]